MAPTAATLNVTLLVAALLLVLLHPSMGRQKGPAHHGPHNTGQQPAARARHCPDAAKHQPAPTPPTTVPAPPPPPTPAPAPPPTPTAATATATATPTPAPAPKVDCPVYCQKQCNQKCQDISGAGIGKCEADYESNRKGCYDICTTNMCPDKCVNSGCSYSSCHTCDNTIARKCCDDCNEGQLYSTYSRCVNDYSRGIQYCMIDCMDGCNKTCTQTQA